MEAELTRAYPISLFRDWASFGLNYGSQKIYKTGFVIR